MRFPRSMADYLKVREEVVRARQAGRARQVNAEWAQIKHDVCMLILKGLAAPQTEHDRLLDQAFDRHWSGPKPGIDLERLEETLRHPDMVELLSAAFQAAVDIDYPLSIERLDS